MRAINLIPAEERRGAGGAAGRSGGAAYALVGVLGALVLLVSAYAIIGRSVSHKRGEVARVEQQAAAAEAQAQGLTSYTTFSQMREQRVQTVKSLAASRFDWSHAMHELARVIPDNVWLTAVTGTVTPGVDVQGATGTTGSLRSALTVPAIEMTGCTTSQSEVARLLTRLRLIDGVQRVTLESSAKADTADGGGNTGGSAGGGGGGDCRNGSDKFPQFGLVVFYDAPQASAAAVPAPGAATGTAVPTAQTTPPTTTTGATK